MENFIRIATVFELPPDVLETAVDLSKKIVGNRSVFFTLDSKALYPLSVHPHITIYAPEYPEHNVEQVLEETQEIA